MQPAHEAPCPGGCWMKNEPAPKRNSLTGFGVCCCCCCCCWRRGAADGERTPDAVAGDRRRRRSTARSARRAQRSEKVDLLERLRRRRRHWKFPHKNEMVNGSVLLDGEQANRFDGIYDRTKEIRCVVLSLNGRRDNGEMLRREESAS